MLFALRVALRYLAANRGQTLLLIAGIALSAMVFVFITALTNGLSVSLIAQITGQISHIDIEPRPRVAEIATADRRFAAQPISTFQRQQIRNWQQTVGQIEQVPHVVAVVPQLNGNGFLVRGTAVAPIAIQGLDPAQIDAIVPITKALIEGSSDLSSGGLVIGGDLADDLGLHVGIPVLLRSDRGVERLIPVTGIFRIGISALDRGVAFVSIVAARPLIDLPEGVTGIAVKLDDANRAGGIADRLRAQLPLKVTSWQEKNRNLESALGGQSQVSMLIQAFSVITIMVSIASTLLLSTVKRRSEIGIMRSFGISRFFVASVFVYQGVIIGLLSSIVGAGIGYRLCVFVGDLRAADGAALLPIAPAQGGYGLVIGLTTLGAALASILPARAAARVDPVEAIQQ